MARVLVIDDEADVLTSLADLLAGMVPGCQVELARGFAEGRAKALAGGWDIVITDERMPDGRGVDLLAELARTQPGTVRVLMSAFHDFDTLLRGVNAAHLDHFIQKPWNPSEVVQWTRRVLKERAAWPGGPPGRSGPFRRMGGPGLRA